MMRWLFALTLLLPLPALAQNAQSLADVKAELAQLAAQFLTLKQELVSSGAAANGSAGGDALQRLDAIEAALTKLTDLGALASGAAAPAVPDPAVVSAPETPAAPAATDGVELAVNEKADFDRAKAVLDSGDFLGAADLFKTYAQSYPGGPLVPQADMYRGDALTTASDTTGAARAYLDAFSASQTGPLAGQALTKLGQALGKLGQGPEACVTLAEVGKRFPGSSDEATAKAAMAAQGCP